MRMTLLDSLARLGEATTILLLREGKLKLAGNFRGREAEVIFGLDEGNWNEKADNG